jgi:hypothetical protein
MFIHLDLGCMAHPFPVGSFRITHAHQIDKIRALGLEQLRWSPERSELQAPRPDSAVAVAVPPEVPSAAATAEPAAQCRSRWRRPPGMPIRPRRVRRVWWSG